METLTFLEENGIETYLSGCLTLTLEAKFPKTSTTPYVCLVDVSPEVMDYVKSKYPDLEIKVMEHVPNQMPALVKQEATWNERFEVVTNLLTIYQNAHAIITSRLHCALPSLALGTPVLLLTDVEFDKGRFDGLSSLVHSAITKDFLSDNVSFSLDTPPKNPDTYLHIRKELIERVQDFVAKTQTCTPELKERFASYDSQWEQRALWKNSLLLKLKEKHVLQWQQTHEAFEQLETGRQWLEGQYHSLITENEKLTDKLNRIPRVVRKIFKAQ